LRRWFCWASRVPSSGGLVQFFKVLAAEVRARVVEVRETDWLDLIDDHEPRPEHPVRDDPRFEAGLTRMLGFDRQISQPQQIPE
jgi:hypothetical protein